MIAELLITGNLLVLLLLVFFAWRDDETIMRLESEIARLKYENLQNSMLKADIEDWESGATQRRWSDCR
jgi:hypothetical protein